MNKRPALIEMALIGVDSAERALFDAIKAIYPPGTLALFDRSIKVPTQYVQIVGYIPTRKVRVKNLGTKNIYTINACSAKLQPIKDATPATLKQGPVKK